MSEEFGKCKIGRLGKQESLRLSLTCAAERRRCRPATSFLTRAASASKEPGGGEGGEACCRRGRGGGGVAGASWGAAATGCMKPVATTIERKRIRAYIEKEEAEEDEEVKYKSRSKE